MTEPAAPTILNTATGMRYMLQYMYDPLRTLRRVHTAHGPYIITTNPRPVLTQRKMVALAVGPPFNREVLGNTSIWRTSGPNPRAPKNSAANRLRFGLVKIGGAAHEHYRRLFSIPLQRARVDELGTNLSAIVDHEVARWRKETPISLNDHSNALLQRIAIGLLFGNDLQNALPVADGIRRNVGYKWSMLMGAFPVDIPGTQFHQMLRDAEQLERLIIDWANKKRIAPADDRDLLSLLLNSPNESGQQVSVDQIVGHVPTLLGAAFETCQNALIWTIVLLDQHPRIARDLLDELQGIKAGTAPDWRDLAKLPLLDAVVRESMRLLPPVPIQTRAATEDTTLGGYPFQRGWHVILSPFLTNRNPNLYPDPNRFRPNRWFSIDPSTFEYGVFSAGPRMCPGYWFGLAALKTSLAHILLRFRPALLPGSKVNFSVRVALVPRHTISILLHPQDGRFVSTPLRGAIRDVIDLPS